MQSGFILETETQHGNIWSDIMCFIATGFGLISLPGKWWTCRLADHFAEVKRKDSLFFCRQVNIVTVGKLCTVVKSIVKGCVG